MNKTLLAAGLSLAMTSTGAWALQGIQIDPTGTGTIGNSFIANGLGSDFGDALLQSLFNVSGGNTGTVYAHNVFDLGTLDPGELTFTMWMEADTSPTTTDLGGGITLIDPNNVILTNPAGHSSYFALFYDPLTGGTLAANHDTGAGYDDGIKLAEGRVSIDLDPGTGSSNFTVTLNLASPNVPLDTEAGSIMSADINGNIFLNVEFFALPALGTYLINDLVTLDIDLEVNGGIRTPFDAVRASDVVGGTADDDGAGDDTVGATLSPGADTENDFTCGIAGNQTPGLNITGGVAVDQDCDAQVQITTVLDFNAESVPEPTTLGLIGAGLGLAGFFSRRRKSVA
jgi:hypothetical protein